MPAFLRLSLLACLLFGAPAVDAATVYKYRDANGVIHLTDKPVKGARKIVFPDRMEEHLEKAVRVERRRLGRGEASMFSLQPANAASPMRYQTRLSVALGDPRATPAGDTFPLPWRGGPFSVSQGANGGYSHFTPKSRYAIDIAMPVGTPIIASRAGVVVKTENRQSGRGRDPSGNFVRVLHADGTMAVYLHLSQGSVRVKEGQRVAQGALLGLSGNTGNSTGPHLHFVVQRNTGMGLVSIPFRFAEPVQDLPAVATGGR
jgi:murein DD-endopeptidase MepM/ murein hydrolase activator NlpD